MEGPGRLSCCVFTKGVCMHMHMCLCVSICGWISSLFYLFSDSDELSVSLPQTAHIKTPSPDAHLHKHTQVCEAEVSRT